LRYAIKESEALGARGAEAYAATSDESEVFIENNDVKQAKSQSASSIGIRVMVGGSVGFYSVNSLAKNKIKDAVAMAMKIARASPKDKHQMLPGKSRVRLLSGIYDKKAESCGAGGPGQIGAEIV
jgi:predicted Zn-dependent protease